MMQKEILLYVIWGKYFDSVVGLWDLRKNTDLNGLNRGLPLLPPFYCPAIHSLSNL